MEEAKKREILSRIERWLDEWPGEEPLPEGLDPSLLEEAEEEGGADLASLTGAFLALRKDVQIQGKVFKRLEEELAPLGKDLRSLREAVEELPALLVRERASGPWDGLMDLYHRLSRALEEGRKTEDRLSFLARLGGARPLLSSLVRGVEMVLGRLEEILGEAGLTPFLPELGVSFDPSSMAAAGVVRAGKGVEDGSVAEVVRAGFFQGGRVIRPAEVKVARRGGAEER